jgi:aryl-alcohol dehydrogenase-like predicted oxidoreductase/predicted kinase
LGADSICFVDCYIRVVRIALGCMRLSTESTRDERAALATLLAALDAGIAIFDTARAYGVDERDLGHNERLLARALRERPEATVRVVTKCGMRRDGGAWVPDGRASSILEDAAASVEALSGIPIDLLLLHAPDPRVPIATSARALARAKEDGLARRVGVSNVSRKQLEMAAAEAPIAGVEIALGAYDGLAIRSGVVGYCIERGIEVLAHSPLGGPERARRLARDQVLARIGARLGVGAVEVFLAYLLAVRPEMVPVVGARRPETVDCSARAATLVLDDETLAELDARFPLLGETRTPRRALRVGRGRAEVVLVMGVPGSGKSRAAETYVARGYERLNRDTEGGTLRKITRLLGERLAAGAERVVLDNTYVTRASRYDVLRVASAHGATVRCLHLDTPLAEAQINVVTRMLQRFGRVLEPEELHKTARRDPTALAPHAVFRMMRELEAPSADEGFDEVQGVPFVREHSTDGQAGTAVALAALGAESAAGDALVELLRDIPESSPLLVFAWKPDARPEWIEALRASARAASDATGHTVEIAVCRHPGGRPICWCRPPLPAMLLAFAHRHRIDLRSSTLIGSSATDLAMASALGMKWSQG